METVSTMLKRKQFYYTYITMYDNIALVQEEAHPLLHFPLALTIKSHGLLVPF